MNILIVSATRFEIAPLLTYLREHFIEFETDRFQQGELQITIAISGVGLTLTAYAMGRLLSQDSYNLAINTGIAGAFNRSLALGDVVQVTSQQFGDLGAEEADGRFLSIHEMGLIEADQFPFQGGKLLNESAMQSDFLPGVSSISVNKVHGYPPHIEQVERQFPVDIESMEGAAFSYACLVEKQSFLEIRAISNYVEARNRANWKIDLALEKLNEVLQQIIGSLLHKR
jgi:futalosine hydrolase